MSWQNSLTIPWHDITKVPDMGQIAKIPWHFLKIPWIFPDLEKILFSLTRGNPVFSAVGSIRAVKCLDEQPRIFIVTNIFN